MDSGNSNHGSPSKRQRLTPRAHELGVMRMSTDNGSASFLGSSSGIHFIRVVYNAFARRSALLNRPQQPSKNTQVPGEDDQLHHQHHQYRPDLWLPDELDLQAPSTSFSFDNLVQWTRGYFQNWHPIFPFCSGPALLIILELISCDGFSSLSVADAILVRSIISITLMDRRQANSSSSQIPVPSVLVFRSVHQAMESLHALFCEPPTIPILQAAFSVQLFLTSLLRLNAASRVGGAIIRTAFHLGLHRCPVRYSGFSPQETSTRRRLFWSIYCLERYLSQALGIPLGIRDDDIDVCYPNAEVHGPAAEEDHKLRLLGHLAKFAQVRGRIIELRNKSINHREGFMDATQVHGELTQWWNEVYDDVYPVEPDENDTLSSATIAPFHSLLLTILRHEAIISMNRPLLAAEASSPEYRTALQICIESSRSLLTTLRQYLSGSPGSSIPLIWPSFTWAVWMSCLILIYAAWEGEFPTSSASRYAKSGLFILQNLSRRGNTWPQTCMEAIHDLDSALTTPEQQTLSVLDTADPRSKDKDPATTTSSDALDPGIPFEMSQNRLQNQRAPSTPALGETLQSATPLPSTITSSQWSNSSLIFGNQAMNNPGVTASGLGLGLGLPDLSIGNGTGGEEPLGIGDLWSLADGPWLIHESFDLAENWNIPYNPDLA
ncbi:fungal-specific transcription factor domain-containing protein [Aspergillus granulosus]|uniref:Fungal-specific transcription factor domain-containing protein n=1 Tax=Aspergillus granulosus TaxID=176169 RepID=A0ABR4HCF7_9EURO